MSASLSTLPKACIFCGASGRKYWCKHRTSHVLIPYGAQKCSCGKALDKVVHQRKNVDERLFSCGTSYRQNGAAFRGYRCLQRQSMFFAKAFLSGGPTLGPHFEAMKKLRKGDRIWIMRTAFSDVGYCTPAVVAGPPSQDNVLALFKETVRLPDEEPKGFLSKSICLLNVLPRLEDSSFDKDFSDLLGASLRTWKDEQLAYLQASFGEDPDQKLGAEG